MSDAKCPSCKAAIYRVRPVRIEALADTPRWDGAPEVAVGFVCANCGVLLPLSAESADRAWLSERLFGEKK